MKNTIILLLTLLICAFFSFPSSSKAGSCGVMGDINRDNKVGLQEAIYALQVASGINVEQSIEEVEKEPNDIQDNPNVIFENTIITGTIGSGSDEEDWYKITMSSNGLFQYSLKNLNSEGTENGIIGETKLYAQEGLDLIEINKIYHWVQYVGNVISPGKQPISPYTAVSGGWVYYIKVPKYSDDSAPYELKTTFVQLATLDIGEDNCDATESYEIQQNANIEALIGYGDDEVDWYSFSPSSNGLLKYTLTNLHPSASEIDQGIIGSTELYQQVGLDLVKLNEIYVWVQYVGNVISPGESPASPYTVVSSGDVYFIKVPSYAYNSAPYNLKADFFQSSVTDIGEPNDSSATSSNIEENDTITAMIGYGNDEEDWYEVTPSANGSFKFELENLLESTAGIDQGIIGETFFYQKDGLDLIKISSIYNWVQYVGNVISPGVTATSNTIAVSGGSTYYIKVPKFDYNAACYTLKTTYLAD